MKLPTRRISDANMFKLLPSQKASLHKVLTSAGFNSPDFDIVQINDRQLQRGEKVYLKNTPFSFTIYEHPGQYSPARFLVSFSP
jgi:hypothetical protein